MDTLVSVIKCVMFTVIERLDIPVISFTSYTLCMRDRSWLYGYLHVKSRLYITIMLYAVTTWLQNLSTFLTLPEIDLDLAIDAAIKKSNNGTFFFTIAGEHGTYMCLHYTFPSRKTISSLFLMSYILWFLIHIKHIISVIKSGERVKWQLLDPWTQDLPPYGEIYHALTKIGTFHCKV